METIKFANGEIHECSFLSTVPYGATNQAFIALSDVDIAQAAAIFSDAEKTTEMQWGEYRLIGYTNLLMLTVQPYGIQATLTGGHDERIG